MIWGSFQAITNIHEKQRKQLWSLPCRVLLRCDLLLSAESKSASPHLPPMGTTAVSSPTVGLYVEASFMLHSYLAPVLGGLKLGGHNKATVLNIASQAAPTPSQLGRTVYWAIPLCRTLCWLLQTSVKRRSSPSCITYKETKAQRDVLADSTSCLGFGSESVNCS